MNILAGTDAGIHLGWYGEDDAGAIVPGVGPDGVATFVLGLEQDYTLTWKWPSSIIPTADGGEQREPRNNRPQETISGGAVLLGDESTDVRNKLAAYIADGSVFLIALPHEQLILCADAAGELVPVSTTAYSDWLNPGQRAVVANNQQFAKTVIQSSGADTITGDVAPGSVGKRGAAIMPLMPVYLEPVQDLERYRTKAERWKINAHAANFGFATTLARISLGAYLQAPFLNAVAVSRQFGLVGNTLVLETQGSGGFPAIGQLVEIGPYSLFRYRPGTTTLGNFRDALLVSNNFRLSGAYNAADTFSILDDAYMEAFGGEASGPVGTGAALTMFAGNPVWDRRLINKATNTDSIDAMTDIIDHGGRIYAVGMANQPRWRRAVNHRGRGLADFQWLKLFFVTVRGPAKVFWLSTWRDDLKIVSFAGPDLTVIGDVKTWYPRLRQHIHVREASGSDVYCEITATVDNGDGTWTLTVDPFPGVDVPVDLSSLFANPVSISWLELCRFADDTFAIKFGAGASHTLTTRAVVVPA